MLKFLRKYQLFIMIIGGSLLMVVFLLEPVITRMAPTAMKQTVATIGADKEKISAMDRELANAEFSAVRVTAPILLSPLYLGLDNQSPGDHWLLLAREAEANGLVGEAGDGRSWVPELALLVAQLSERARLQQLYGNLQGLPQQYINQLINQQMDQEQIAANAAMLEAQFPLEVIRATASNPFLKTPDDTYRALAKARGIMRLITLHRTASRRSIPESLAVMNDALDGVAVDVMVLDPALIVGTIPDPSPEQLQAHFERFKDLLPADSDLGVGYILPPRIKFEYLTLDADVIADAISVDRVEISKRFQRNPAAYGESLESTSLNDVSMTVAEQIESEIRVELTQSVMTEADRTIRGILLTAMRGLGTNKDGTLAAPEGWTAPSLESIALQVSTSVKLPGGQDMPLPTFTRHASSWLTGTDIQALEQIGQAGYRIGAQGYFTAAIPGMVAKYLDEGVLDESLPIQIGIPYVDTAATDASGNRYYVNVLEARSDSAAEDIAEAGIDRVSADYAQVRAFETFVESANSYLDIARATGFDGLSGQFSETSTPFTAQNVIVYENQQTFPQTVAAAGTQEARTAVIAAARDRLEPLQAPGEIDPLNAFLSVELPGSRSLAIFKLIARRPLTIEQNRLRANSVLLSQANAEMIGVEDFRSKYPFTFESMKRRYQFEVIKRKQDEIAKSGVGTETDESTDDTQEADDAPVDDQPADEG